MQTIKHTEVVPFVKKANLSFVRFLDKDHEVVVGWNVQKGKTVPTAESFETKLKSDIYPDGIYYLQVKDTLNGKAKTVGVSKGNISADINLDQLPEIKPLAERKLTILSDKSKESGSVSYEQFMELQIECINLRFQNEYLKELIDEYEADESLNDEQQQTSEITTFLKDVGIPLIDKYFDIQEKKLQLLDERLMTKRTTQPETRTAPLQRVVKVHRPAFTPEPAQTTATAQAQHTQTNIDPALNRDFNTETSDIQLTPEEQEFIEQLKSYDEAQILEFYSQFESENRGAEAYQLISYFRPDMLYIFNSGE